MLARERENLLEGLPLFGHGPVEERRAGTDLAEDRKREQSLAVRGDGVRRQRAEAPQFVGREIEGGLVPAQWTLIAEALPSPLPLGRITPQP